MKQVLFLIFCFFQFSVLNGQHCDASAYDTDYEWIESVRFDARTNYSDASPGYDDFYDSAAPFRVVAGACHNININVGYANVEYPEYYGVWIDLNEDGDFGDSGEEFFRTTSPNVGGIAGNIVIPAETALGEVRMRVVMKYGAPADPCGLFNYGEVEDYKIEILAENPTCSGIGRNTHYEYINSVKINGWNITTGDNQGYLSDFCQGFYLNMGLDNEIVLDPGFNGAAYPEIWQMWIDYNKDDDFNDHDELVYTSTPNNGTDVFDLSIPNYLVPNEIYRLRISMKYGSAASNACSTSGWGEIEDYQVVVLDPLGVAGSLHAESSNRSRAKKLSNTVNHHVSINPNPADVFAHVQFRFERDVPKKYRVINMQGKTMETSIHNSTSMEIQLDVRDYPDGYYLFQTMIGDEWQAIPFIVMH